MSEHDDERTPSDLRAMEDALARVRDEENEILREIESMPPSLLEARALEGFRRFVGDNAPAAVPSPRRIVTPLAVAASILLGVFAYWLAGHRGDDGGDVPRVALSGKSKHLEFVAPRGRVASYLEFRCTSDLPAGTQYELVIVDLSPAQRPPITKHLNSSTAWIPAAAESKALPPRLRAIMRALDPDGALIDSVTIEAWLDG